MSFRDCLTNRWFRGRVEREFDRYDNIRFGPLESASYASADALRVKWLLYAAEHADHFRP